MQNEHLFETPKSTPEGYDKIFLLSEDCCPNCESCIPDSPYFHEGDKFPEIYNYRSSCTDWGHFYYWDEYHVCGECETKYYLESGN